MSFLQAIIIAIIQGATELFPVSSLGHAVIVPALLGWHIDQGGDSLLPFLVVLHFGTLLALLLFFWRDWYALAHAILLGRDPTLRSQSLRIVGLLIVATIPAVLVGGLFEHTLRRLFGSPSAACLFLILNGAMLLFCEWMRSNRRPDYDKPVAAMTLRDSVAVGIWQCLAFFPGISRSGATITGGLFRGLTHDVSARFSFLIAQPVILGATVKEAFKARHTPIPHDQFLVVVTAAIVAALTALLSTAFLMRYFHNHERWALSPFGYYCVGAGAIAFLLLQFGL
ncbi:UDP pyrophosphate phosphatase [Ameyamaea chiangmaiensis NBRC 103196]|uniref:Undecaprenyl-diphosphatase n=1 Tax=Ameyamaea chiangmaiensis TaxID=442969 RepID=A0A850P799_9PROT|nr:undecaprenyl-diphosphate phosphatase [Ameyamaea chiangmaiensis]MBS4073724.1 undecaprenyl-diphosphate phosphatase [Ameyamaea chiangmaiensis]NVN39784.1 undecaprenyl-diphosphate phosphatase [Ameyamaea chiangmaiensis]GBQ68682.1 UDP pyrophosphate phosphatase [Ameyamaea chiangmaiensis NBRC 103196]